MFGGFFLYHPKLQCCWWSGHEPAWRRTLEKQLYNETNDMPYSWHPESKLIVDETVCECRIFCCKTLSLTDCYSDTSVVWHPRQQLHEMTYHPLFCLTVQLLQQGPFAHWASFFSWQVMGSQQGSFFWHSSNPPQSHCSLSSTRPLPQCRFNSSWVR